MTKYAKSSLCESDDQNFIITSSQMFFDTILAFTIKTCFVLGVDFSSSAYHSDVISSNRM